MITFCADVKKQIFKDAQKNRVYDFDSLLEKEIEKIERPFETLWEKYGRKPTIQEISNFISTDFGLPVKDIKTTNANQSFYQTGSITLNQYHKNNIEVLMHEYAHYFCDVFFRTKNQTIHGGEFMSVFRFLLNHYNLISTEKFNQLINIEGLNVDVYTDFIVSFDNLTEKEYLIKIDEAKQKYSEEDIYFWDSWGYIERYFYSSKTKYFNFIKNESNNKFFLITLKKLGYENDGLFDDLTNDDINNTVLVSPSHLMDHDGFPCRGRYSFKYYGFSVIKGEDFFNTDYIHFYSSYNTVEFLSNGEDLKDKKETNTEKKDYINYLKNKGFNVIITKSIKEYREMGDIFVKKFKELNQLKKNNQNMVNN